MLLSGKIRPWVLGTLRAVIPLILLGGCWYVTREAAVSAVPPGAEEQMWPPLTADLRALGLLETGTEVDVLVVSSDVRGATRVPTDALYVVRGVNSARLTLAAPWQRWGVPERPASVRVGLFGRRRPGKADDCPGKLAQEMFFRREVERAVLAWQEPSPQGPRAASLTVWRERPSALLSPVNRSRVCVESRRGLTR